MCLIDVWHACEQLSMPKGAVKDAAYPAEPMKHAPSRLAAHCQHDSGAEQIEQGAIEI